MKAVSVETAVGEGCCDGAITAVVKLDKIVIVMTGSMCSKSGGVCTTFVEGGGEGSMR
jgi:hypothetical protein